MNTTPARRAAWFIGASDAEPTNQPAAAIAEPFQEFNDHMAALADRIVQQFEGVADALAEFGRHVRAAADQLAAFAAAAVKDGDDQ